MILGGECHQRVRRQQQGGGIIWAGITGDRLVGPVRIPEGVKITSVSYCGFLNDVLVPWLDDIPLALLRNVIFMHDNAPSHSARNTSACLESLGLHGKKLIVWPPCSPDLNPIDNFWALLKMKIYAHGRQFNSKSALWDAIVAAAGEVPPSAIKKLA